MPNTYYAGALVRVATYSGSPSNPVGGFRDANGNLADPTTVTLLYRQGTSGALQSATYPAAPVVKDGTGLYHADLDTTGSAEQVWAYAWKGAGAIQAVSSPPGSFTVRVLI